MNFDNIGFSYQPYSNTSTNQIREEHQKNGKKTILQIGIIITLISLFLTSIIISIYTLINRQYCINNINPITTSPTGIHTSATDAMLPIDNTKERTSLLNPCIEQNVEYKKWGMPIQNYSLYTIDASLLISTALISIKITMYPSNTDCAWSLDIFPMDGRPIPTNSRPTNSVFGYYDQSQNSNIERFNVSTLAYWGAGTGKFLVGITGAWYGAGNVGCQGHGTIKICFSHP